MSEAWGWYVLILTILSMLACFWLIAYSNRQRNSPEEIAESESHVWDEDVRELNNPLPMWWLWLFIGTLIWAAGYLIYYPGLLAFDGASGWSQEKQYEEEMAAAEARFAPIFERYASMPVEELVADEQAMGIGKSLFGNPASRTSRTTNGCGAASRRTSNSRSCRAAAASCPRSAPRWAATSRSRRWSTTCRPCRTGRTRRRRHTRST